MSKKGDSPDYEWTLRFRELEAAKKSVKKDLEKRTHQK